MKNAWEAIEEVAKGDIYAVMENDGEPRFHDFEMFVSEENLKSHIGIIPRKTAFFHQYCGWKTSKSIKAQKMRYYYHIVRMEQ